MGDRWELQQRNTGCFAGAKKMEALDPLFLPPNILEKAFIPAGRKLPMFMPWCCHLMTAFFMFPTWGRIN